MPQLDEGRDRFGGWQRTAASGLAALQLAQLRRAILAMLFGVGVIAAVMAFYLQHGGRLMDRARLAEVFLKLDHARADVVLERALRPAHGAGVPGEWPRQGDSNSVIERDLALRYERDGDRLLARFRHRDAEGVWTMEPVEDASGNAWVQNWRCFSQATGHFQTLAQTRCPALGADDKSHR